MVLQILADSGKVKDGFDPCVFQLLPVTDTRQHQQLRRIDCAAGQNNFAARLRFAHLPFA